MPRGDTSLPGAVANGNKFSRRKMEMKALCIVHARECERERETEEGCCVRAASFVILGQARGIALTRDEETWERDAKGHRLDKELDTTRV